MLVAWQGLQGEAMTQGQRNFLAAMWSGICCLDFIMAYFTTKIESKFFCSCLGALTLGIAIFFILKAVRP